MPALLDQVQDHAGVELAGAGAHRQAVERGEAHGRLDAAAGEQRAHRGAAAEVGDDHPAAGDLRGEFGEAAGDVLVAQAVEAVAADALVVEGARKGVAVGVLGVAAVEGGVEAGDLRQARVDRRDDADGGEVVRLVQRRQRLERGQAGEDVGVDAHRAVEVGAAVDDAVADGAELDAAEAGEPAAQRLGGRAAGRGARRRPSCGRRAGAPSAPVARSRGRTPMPSIWPRTWRSRPASAARSWNFRLDEPALRTRIASMRQTAGTGAVRRSALA